MSPIVGILAGGGSGIEKVEVKLQPNQQIPPT